MNKKINDVSLFGNLSMVDPLTEILYSNVPPGKRPRRGTPMEDVGNKVMEKTEIEQHLQTNSWRTLAIGSRLSIINLAENEAAQILEFWILRIESLVQLRHYDLALKEIENLSFATMNSSVLPNQSCFTLDYLSGDQLWLLKWPFELQLLWALLPNLTNQKIDLSIDRICLLLDMYEKTLESDFQDEPSEHHKQKSVLESKCTQLNICLSGLMLKENNYILAIDLVKEELEKRPNDPYLLSYLGRICLKSGLVKEATAHFLKVEKLLPASEISQTNNGLLLLANDCYEQARDCFLKIASEDSDNYSAVNNFALCDLYLGNVSRMLESLQLVMQSMPSNAGTDETLVYNYCSAIDLGCSSDWKTTLKTQKLIDVAQWAGDSFDITALKLK